MVVRLLTAPEQCGACSLVWLKRRVVVPKIEGSSPFRHPRLRVDQIGRLFCYHKNMNDSVKLVVYVPVKNADELRSALGEAGAGVIGEYSFCSYSVIGTGRFMPSDKAAPHIGEAGKLESVKEERIEVTCSKSAAPEIIAKIKQVHPYEEVVVDVYPLIVF